VDETSGNFTEVRGLTESHVLFMGSEMSSNGIQKSEKVRVLTTETDGFYKVTHTHIHNKHVSVPHQGIHTTYTLTHQGKPLQIDHNHRSVAIKRGLVTGESGESQCTVRRYSSVPSDFLSLWSILTNNAGGSGRVSGKVTTSPSSSISRLP
jgi:uncharacterized protein YgiM (DUF1202 family)